MSQNRIKSEKLDVRTRIWFHLDFQVIDVKVILTAFHDGWFQFRLCDYGTKNPSQEATEECLDQNILKVSCGSTRSRVATPIPNVTSIYGENFSK